MTDCTCAEEIADLQAQIVELTDNLNIVAGNVTQLQEDVVTMNADIDQNHDDIIVLSTAVNLLIAKTSVWTWSVYANSDLKNGISHLCILAPGANKIQVVEAICFKFKYGGTNVFTNAADIDILYGSNLVKSCNLDAGFWGATTDRMVMFDGLDWQNEFNASSVQNTIVQARVTQALTGNAANNNTVEIVVIYSVIEF